jgi:hypothetical protein
LVPLNYELLASGTRLLEAARMPTVPAIHPLLLSLAKPALVQVSTTYLAGGVGKRALGLAMDAAGYDVS